MMYTSKLYQNTGPLNELKAQNVIFYWVCFVCICAFGSIWWKVLLSINYRIWQATWQACRAHYPSSLETLQFTSEADQPWAKLIFALSPSSAKKTFLIFSLIGLCSVPHYVSNINQGSDANKECWDSQGACSYKPVFLLIIWGCSQQGLLIITHVSLGGGSLEAAVLHEEKRMSCENIWLCEIVETWDKNLI